MSEERLIDKSGATTILALNRPNKAHALDAPLAEALAAAISDSRAADLADRVRSAIEPVLKERVGEYRKG